MGVTDPLAKVKEPLQSSLSLVRSNLTRSGRTLKVAPESNEISNAPADSSKSDGSWTLSISMQIRGVGDKWSMTCTNTLPTGAALIVRIDVSATLMDPLALPVNIDLSLGLKGPREESRTFHEDSGAGDHRPPSQSSKMVLSTVHVGGLAWTRTNCSPFSNIHYSADLRLSVNVLPFIRSGPNWTRTPTLPNCRTHRNEIRENIAARRSNSAPPEICLFSRKMNIQHFVNVHA